MKAAFLIILFSALVMADAFAGDNLSSFIPKGYKLDDSVVADLNGDSLPDVLLVLAIDDDLDSFQLAQIFPPHYNYAARPFEILIRQSNGVLKKMERNDHVIPDWLESFNRINPLGGISATTGSFTIVQLSTMGGKNCSTEIYFKYNHIQYDWFLASVVQNCTATPQNKTADTNTGQVTFSHTAKDFGKVPFLQYNCNKQY